MLEKMRGPRRVKGSSERSWGGREGGRICERERRGGREDEKRGREGGREGGRKRTLAK